MKILVISDTHGNLTTLKKIFSSENDYEGIIHCGDGINDLIHIDIKRGVNIIKVNGNIDRARGLEYPVDYFECIGGYKFFITHGDKYNAHNDITGIWVKAKENNCDIACFGHTHKPMYEKSKPVMFNPGPAQSGFYGKIIITNNGIECEIKNIKY